MSLLPDHGDLNDNLSHDLLRSRETAYSNPSPMPVEPHRKVDSIDLHEAGSLFLSNGKQRSWPRPPKIEIPLEEVQEAPSSGSCPKNTSSVLHRLPPSRPYTYRRHFSSGETHLISGADVAALVEQRDRLRVRARRQDSDCGDGSSSDDSSIGESDDRLEDVAESNARSPARSNPIAMSHPAGSPAMSEPPIPSVFSDSVSPEPWAAFANTSDTSTPWFIDLEGSSCPDTMDEMIEQDGHDCANNLIVQKQYLLERLMLSVHLIFAASGFLSRRGNEDSTPGKHTGVRPDSASKGVVASLRLVKGVKRGRDDDGDDDRKRERKTRDNLPDSSSPIGKKLACPYFKHDPQRNRSSRACYGPGFVTTARMKAHLYRVHSKPLHCRRCYSTFENEAQLTEHSRSIDCAVGDLQSVEGFDKDQEKMLKSRSPMFEAEDEEDKWRIIYLMLFPDTPLGNLPSPYYHVDDEVVPARSADDSPESPALAQFHAFLRRELPRTVRKRLQTMLESKLGPLEETLKNEVESVVRDCQETLTHSYLKEAGTSTGPSYAPESIHGPSHITQPSSLRKMPPSYDLEADECFVSPAADLDVGTSSRHLMPSTTTYYPCPEHRHIDGVSEAPANSLDSAYFSLAEDINASSFDFAWGLTGFEQTALDKLLETHDGRATEAIDTSIESFYGFNEQQHYTGKGKDVAP